jgi:hypothetical protein
MRDKQPKSAQSKHIALLQLPLVKMIKRKLLEERCTLITLAERYQISYSMLNSVVNSTRWVAHSDKDTVVRPLAKLLGVPVVTIYIKAGLLTHQDFVLEETLETRLSEAYDVMSGDQTMMAMLPASKEAFMRWPVESRSALALLYQTFARKELLDMARIGHAIEPENGWPDEVAKPLPRAQSWKSAAAADRKKPSKPAVKKPFKPVAPLSIQAVTSWQRRK